MKYQTRVVIILSIVCWIGTERVEAGPLLVGAFTSLQYYEASPEIPDGVVSMNYNGTLVNSPSAPPVNQLNMPFSSPGATGSVFESAGPINGTKDHDLIHAKYGLSFDNNSGGGVALNLSYADFSN